MTTSDPSHDLDDRVIRLVREYWEEHRMPLLLSQLGGQDGGSIAKQAKQRTGSLAKYLRTQTANHVRVIQHSTNYTVVGAIPLDVAPNANQDSIDELLERTQHREVRTTPRFHSAFWTAFRKPLDQPMRRFISLQAPIRFQDLASEEEPHGFIEIERQYVVGFDAEETEVHKTAQDWLSDNKVEEALFLWKAETKTTHLPPDDLLGRLLLALEPDELRRISMPLDIVSKLRSESL